MSDLDGTTTVRVELRGRTATIADVRDALAVLTADGIPDTFEVDLCQWEDRDDRDTTIAYSDRPTAPRFYIEARRAAATL